MSYACAKCKAECNGTDYLCPQCRGDVVGDRPTDAQHAWVVGHVRGACANAFGVGVARTTAALLNGDHTDTFALEHGDTTYVVTVKPMEES